jgi:hypothetical protein
MRGCSIWAVEMLRRQIANDHPEAKGEVNAILLDFLLYDLAKEVESTGTLRACGACPCEFMRVPARQPSPRQPISVQDGWLHKHPNEGLSTLDRIHELIRRYTQAQRPSLTTEHGVFGTSSM